MDAGQTETIPIVHNGVMYVVESRSGGAGAERRHRRRCCGSTNASWRRNAAGQARSKNLAIYQDVVLFKLPTPWSAWTRAPASCAGRSKTDGRGNTSGPFVADGKVITGGACAGKRENCFILANDALTGKELWRFYTTPAKGEPGDESWGGAAVENRLASTWGLPGSYDPVRKMLYWGVANPMPDQRMRGMTAMPTRSRAPRRRICTATRPSLWIRPPASSLGIISICPPTIGTPITRMSARCCAPRSIPIRSS